MEFTQSTVAHAVVGGLASVAGGGKFANGAVTAAFGYLFNEAGRGPTDRHGMGRQAAMADAVNQGYDILQSTETVVSLPGFPVRRYDFVVYDPYAGQQIGVEVKTSWLGTVFLNRKQVDLVRFSSVEVIRTSWSTVGRRYTSLFGKASAIVGLIYLCSTTG